MNSKSSFTDSAGSPNPRLEIAHRPHAVLALLELAIPLGGRQRLLRLEVEVVRAIAPRRAPLDHPPRAERVHRRQRRATFVPRRLAHEGVFAEFRESDWHDGDREYAGTERIQVRERAKELGAVVHAGHEHNLRMKRDAPLDRK